MSGKVQEAQGVGLVVDLHTDLVKYSDRVRNCFSRHAHTASRLKRLAVLPMQFPTDKPSRHTFMFLLGPDEFKSEHLSLILLARKASTFRVGS